MKIETKELLFEAIIKCIPIVQKASENHLISARSWRREGENAWQSFTIKQPDIHEIYFEAEEAIACTLRTFMQAFVCEYPQYLGQVGLANSYRRSFGRHDMSLPSIVLNHIWKRFGTFAINESQVDILVQDFASFVDSSVVTFTFMGQLLNFKMQGDNIDLPEGIRIRRMSDEEVSYFHRLFDPFSVSRPRVFGIQEFCIEGDIEVQVAFGDLNPGHSGPKKDALTRLNNSLMWLRSFQDGVVGYDHIHFFPNSFSMLDMPESLASDFPNKHGTYVIGDEGEAQLVKHANMLSGSVEPAMELACRRLAESETRSKPQDQVFDAIVGMEALLLAGLRSEDRRGELKYRFSLNYSTLFDKPNEKYDAFRLAKTLYDLRSHIAHGGATADTKYKIGDKKETLHVAARKASDTLRGLIKHFLPEANHAPYKRHEFWERAYFGLGSQP